MKPKTPIKLDTPLHFPYLGICALVSFRSYQTEGQFEYIFGYPASVNADAYQENEVLYEY